MKDSKDITDLQKEVALLNQFNKEVVKPALNDIQDTLKHLSYVHTDDFIAYQKEVDKRFKNISKKSWIQNSVSATFGAMLTAIVIFMFNYFMSN